MTTTPNLPDGPSACDRCGKQASPIVLQGAELEPICMPCLAEIDPARAALLSKIRR